MKFNSLEDAVKYFTSMQADIIRAKEKADTIQRENSELSQALKEYVDLLDRYKKETKQYFGICDGEAVNIVQIANMIVMGGK